MDFFLLHKRIYTYTFILYLVFIKETPPSPAGDQRGVGSAGGQRGAELPEDAVGPLCGWEVPHAGHLYVSNNNIIIASEESFLLSHMADPKNAIKSLILVIEQFCMKHFLIIFQF